MPAEVARREIARVYDASLRPARSDLERAAREVGGIAQGLRETVGRMRGRYEQRARLMRTGFLAAAAGFVAFPLLAFPLARALPFGHLPDRLAAAALGTDPWSAGAELMSHADPGRWSDLVEGYRQASATGGDLRSCLIAAQTTGREQRCSVTVRPSPDR